MSAYNPPLIFGPIAPENNPPIMPQFFKPSQFIISALTLGITTLVTTVVNHNYVIGQGVRLTIPQPNGSFQLNESQGLVISIPAANQVVLNIDSSHNVNPFIATINSQSSPPQIMAIGDINSGQLSTTGPNVVDALLPGSFQNISPAPFL